MKLFENLKIYSGIELSANGWTLLFGGKLAGIKLLFPWTGIERSFISQDNADSSENIIKKHLGIGAAFLGISYATFRYQAYERSKKINCWLENEFPRLLRK